jgi:hypothetical protein
VIGQNALTQEIKGDTIYTSISAQANLYFNETITFCDYTEEAAYINFYKRVENSIVSVRAKIKNAPPALMNTGTYTQQTL